MPHFSFACRDLGHKNKFDQSNTETFLMHTNGFKFLEQWNAIETKNHQVTLYSTL